MNHQRFSYIAHKNLKFCNPIGEAKFQHVIQLLKLSSESRAVDIGAGKGELAIRLIEQHDLKVDAVDLSGELLAESENLSQGRIEEDRLNTVTGDGPAFLAESVKEYDLAVCVGSTHALGGYQKTLEQLSQAVKPRGYLLVGEEHWKNPPTKEFLEFLGSSEEDLVSHEAHVTLAESLGLTPLWAVVANQDEWDAYEWSYSLAVEEYSQEHPEDPEVPAYLEKISKWRRATLKWGRDTFGFGLYLLRNGEKK